MRLAKSIAVGAAAAMFLVVLSAPGLQAQSQPMKVTIPFAFHVADKTLPAGDYIVQNIGEALRISDSKGHAATVLANPTWKRPKGEKDELVFTGYGSDFFLSEARWVGYKNARGIMKSRAEKALANALSPDSVHVAALVR